MGKRGREKEKGRGRECGAFFFDEFSVSKCYILSAFIKSVIYLKRFSMGKDGIDDFQSLLGPSATHFYKKGTYVPKLSSR